jgi:hypothetical protein
MNIKYKRGTIKEVHEDFLLKASLLEVLATENVRTIFIDEFSFNNTTYSPKSWFPIGRENYFEGSDRMKSISVTVAITKDSLVTVHA